MNLILFDQAFETIELSGEDSRARHILSVLKIKEGGVFYIGFVNGPRALAKLVSRNNEGAIKLVVVDIEPAPKCLPIDLLIAVPRPHTAKRILYEAASIGVRSLNFFTAQKTEPSYLKSRLWEQGHFKERLHLGAEQSFATHIPEVLLFKQLDSAIEHFSGRDDLIALDNYGAKKSLGQVMQKESKTTSNQKDLRQCALAFGPEGGFTDYERAQLQDKHWFLAHLGPRVLRLETAVLAASAIASEQFKFWEEPTQSPLSRIYG